MQPTELTPIQRRLADARSYSKADILAKHRRGDLDRIEAQGALDELDAMPAAELLLHAATVRQANETGAR